MKGQEHIKGHILANSPRNRLFPFFWQHGEDHVVLLDELEQIRSAGFGGFCVEARPHPDFAGLGWWRDLDFIMDYARQNRMQVWLLDDDAYPSGHCNGAFKTQGHQLANRFLAQWHTDVLGPVESGAMAFAAALPPDAELLGVVAFARADEGTTGLEPGTAVDLSARVANGWLRWRVPEGLWRVLAFYTTSFGDGKRDYFNVLDSRSVRLLLDTVYEPHYQRYADDFGETFSGFFSDEPEFGNLPGYDFRVKLGESLKFLPWSKELESVLKTRWGDAFLTRLPALWYDCNPATPHLRYEYMDAVTRQIARSFTGQIGEWCRAHGVLYVGHVIEDDNAHGRLGCGAGHYFRSLSGMSMAGIDVVHLEIMPGMDQTVHQWIASDRDGEFFHYGLAKLGASLSHIDPKKRGDALCEIFGAYGWQEGCGLMKWLADHMLASGINCFVPHSFSPKAFPDPDCPPHFNARGNHAQLKVFGRLTAYMDRLCARLSGGEPLPAVAVLYHAESEWAGEAMLYQKPMRELLCAQLDCDVVPADLLAEENPYGGRFEGGLFKAGTASYYALVVPACRYLPAQAAVFVRQAAEHGFPVWFIDGYPGDICELDAEDSLLDGVRTARVVPLAALADTLRRSGLPPLVNQAASPGLRVLPCQKDGTTLLFCFNESAAEVAEAMLQIKPGHPVKSASRYDAWENRTVSAWADIREDVVHLRFALEPGEAALFLLAPDAARLAHDATPAHWRTVDGPWELGFRLVGEGGSPTPLIAAWDVGSFPDLTDWAIEKRFNGTLCYKAAITADRDKAAWLALPGGADAAEIFCNGASLGQYAGRPIRVRLPLMLGENTLAIETPLTPVYAVEDPWSAMVMMSPPGLIEKPLLGE